MSLVSRKGDTTLVATITELIQPGVVFTTFHRPETGAKVGNTEISDWATNCPEYNVTAVGVTPENHRSGWQLKFAERAEEQGRIQKIAAFKAPCWRGASGPPCLSPS